MLIARNPKILSLSLSLSHTHTHTHTHMHHSNESSIFFKMILVMQMHIFSPCKAVQNVMLYSHIIKYAYIHIYMQNTYWRNNKDERRILKKNIPLTLFERLRVRGIWSPKRAAIYCTPPLWPSALCFSRSPGLLNRRLGGSTFCWVLAFSTTSCLHLVWSPN